MFRFAIALTVAVIGLGAFGSSVLLAEEAKCDGTIAKIEGDLVTVKTVDAQHELTVLPSTNVTLDGKPARTTDLKVGMKVKCTAEKQGEKLNARSVEAMSN
jgi:hypothetical protein